MKILVLDTLSIPARNTGSGNQVIRWGLAKGLVGSFDEANWIWICTGNRKVDLRSLQQSADALCVMGWRPKVEIAPQWDSAVAILRGIMDDRRPNVVLVYGVQGAKLFRACGSLIPFGIMSVDLEHLPPFYRLAFRLEYGNLVERLRALKNAPQSILNGLSSLLRLQADYSGAAFILNHAAMHAEWLRKKTDLPTLYTPNPVAWCPVRKSSPVRSAAPARFLLLGGLGGIATLSGLGFFAYRVLPYLKQSLDKKILEIHTIGKGELPSRIGAIFREYGIVQQGYVEDLHESLSAARALLVPTPIHLGFRTRILDCFRQGICVIAHQANAAGMPELIHQRNCLLAVNGKDFARQILSLTEDHEIAKRLVVQARSDFEETLMASRSCASIVRFIGETLKAISTAETV